MHQSAWVLAPLTLVAVLAFSASTKIGKGESLRKIVRNLRLTDRILPVPLARAIPWIELAIAVGLLTPWRWTFAAGAVGATVLMVAYWLLIARGMTLTPRPTCGCFGQAGDHRITWRTLLRNTLLVAAAAASVALAWSGRTGWTLLSGFGSADWLWLALAALASVVTAIVLGRFEPEAAAAPTFAPNVSDTSETTDPAHREAGGDAAATDDDLDYRRRPFPNAALVDGGTPLTLVELASTRPQLLVFVNCYCASTQNAMDRIESWAQRLPQLDVRPVFSLPYDAARLFNPPSAPLFDHAGLTWDAFGLTHSPSAVLLGADGLLAGGPISGFEDIDLFVDDIEAELADIDAPVDDGAEIEDAGVRTGPEQEALSGDR